MKLHLSKILKNNFLLLTIFFIIIFQTLLYTNNNQRTSFKYFKWTSKEISVGLLINISFFSGLFVSTLINTTTISYKKVNFENKEVNYEPLNAQEDNESNIEMPPQRDIRDTQPTISVNYRVVKNTEENNLKRDQNYSSSSDNKGDWDNDHDDW